MKRSRIISTILLGLGVLLFASTTGVAQTYTYDEAGRLTGASYADGSTITYSYDANGNLLERAATTPTTSVEGGVSGVSGSSLTVGPNPVTNQATIGVTTNQTGPLLLSIVDLQGTIVATLTVEQSNSDQVVRWDGTGQTGEPVPSGLYVVRLLTEENQTIANARVLVLR